MPASTLITAGSGAILVPSALSYPQATDPTIYLPYDSPQVITSSGTWKHPKPGFALSITYLLIGGGGSTTDYGGSGFAGSGGGGSGRISPFTTAIVTTNLEVTIGAGATASASVGGTTTFNGLSVAGGSFGTAPANAGGAGGDGGCGGGGGANGHSANVGGAGGNGLDYTGGGGGSSGNAGGPNQTLGGSPGYSTRGPYAAQRGHSGANSVANGGTGGGGWPNGAGASYGTGTGGDLTLIFNWVRGYGAGGTSLSYNSAHNDGYSGAVFIFYNRP